MNLACTRDDYAELYARWLIEPGKLLDLAELKSGERVIDLCGGTGIVAREAVRRGAASAFVVDLNPRVDDSTIDHSQTDYRLVPPFRGRAEEVDQLLAAHVETLHAIRSTSLLSDTRGCMGASCRCRRYSPDFDLVVCRQAIGYLDLQQTARAVAKVLRPGGRFVFNCFQRPRWALKTYVHDGKRFIEASGYIGRTVMHVQAAPGIGIDVTKFRWHREIELDRALDHFFSMIKKVRSERSLYYVCTKAAC